MTTPDVREALADAIELLEGWIAWKCPAKHKDAHYAHLDRLRAALAAPSAVAGEPSDAAVARDAAPIRRDDEREAFERLVSCAGGTINHWHEFGPESGFDEQVDQLRRARDAAISAAIAAQAAPTTGEPK